MSEENVNELVNVDAVKEVVDAAVEESGETIKQELNDEVAATLGDVGLALGVAATESGNLISTELGEAASDVGADIVTEFKEVVAADNKVEAIIEGVKDIGESIVEEAIEAKNDIVHGLSDNVHLVVEELVEVLKKHNNAITAEVYEVIKKLISVAVSETINQIKKNSGGIIKRLFKAIISKIF